MGNSSREILIIHRITIVGEISQFVGIAAAAGGGSR